MAWHRVQPIDTNGTNFFTAANPGVVTVGGSLASAFESVTVDDTADILTAATYGTSKRALLTVETAQIRFRLDGTAPTSSVGHIANAGDQIVLASNGDIANFKAIRTTSTSATLRCSYSS